MLPLATTGTLRTAVAGRVADVGWKDADGAEPASIVIVAHSADLLPQTWCAHIHDHTPQSIRADAGVKAGQGIGYEGDTAHSTGARPHRVVCRNGPTLDPRLFM